VTPHRPSGPPDLGTGSQGRGRAGQPGVEITYDVRIWNPRKVLGKRGTTYETRWVVGRRQRSKTFVTRAAAVSFVSELRAATNRGEPFDAATGLPVALLPDTRDTTWWQWAVTYIDLKWPTLAPNSRRSVAEAITAVTMALLPVDRGAPAAVELRSAMMGWVFVTNRRTTIVPPPGVAEAVRWLERHSRPLKDLEKPALAREVLTKLSLNLDGKPAAATTAARKRAVLFNCFELAVERELLVVNPLTRVRWRAPKTNEAVDPVTVINPTQARALLDAVAAQPNGRRLVAFFGCMYYSALRPAEALALQREDLDLPQDPAKAGWLRLARSNPNTVGRWTDEGRRTPRQLKHRAVGSVRMVPCPPELCVLLRAHLAGMPPAWDGRLFQGPYSGDLRDEDYLKTWRAARAIVLTPGEVALGKAKRPYDLRHAAVSTWLAAGHDPARIATWAGHSVAVLLRTYVHLIGE
jgi:integrase